MVAWKRKKAELSINFLILLVIALIVLAVVVYIFTKNATKADDDLSGCESKGGQCVSPSSSCPNGYAKSGFFNGGCDEGDVCCVPIEVSDRNR